MLVLDERIKWSIVLCFFLFVNGKQLNIRDLHISIFKLSTLDWDLNLSQRSLRYHLIVFLFNSDGLANVGRGCPASMWCQGMLWFFLLLDNANADYLQNDEWGKKGQDSVAGRLWSKTPGGEKLDDSKHYSEVCST